MSPIQHVRHSRHNGLRMQKRQNIVAAFVVLIDNRQRDCWCSRRATFANSSRPLSDVTNLLSSKTRADSTIERDNRAFALASMTRIRHTFNFRKNSVTLVENVRLDESRDTTQRSIERTAFVMRGENDCRQRDSNFSYSQTLLFFDAVP